MEIHKYHSDDLYIDTFTLHPGEQWCFVGTFDSGIDAFLQCIENRSEQKTRTSLLAGQGTCILPERRGVVSFARQQELYELELYKDESDFLERPDPGTPARAFLQNQQSYQHLIEAWNMAECLDTGYRFLSSGQARKLCLLAEISRGVDLLVVQNPYEGLDSKSCQELDTALAGLQTEMQVIVLVNNKGDIPTWCTHIGVFSDKRLVAQGCAAQVLPLVESYFQHSSLALTSDPPSCIAEPKSDEDRHKVPVCPLVLLRNGFASYGDKPVFSGLNVQIDPGDHTFIAGPNGSGKSTLLHLITGEHPLCYKNDLCLFGIQRGTGESIWHLKEKMGIVTPDLHRSYRAPASALQVILSGYYDSIGLYTRPNVQQIAQAKTWLRRIGLADKEKISFRACTYAEQRLLLIARGLIKIPPLLILDEISQGLDQPSRMAVLDFLELLVQKKWSTLLYISHREDECRSFFTQQLLFRQGEPGGMAQIEVRRLDQSPSPLQAKKL